MIAVIKKVLSKNLNDFCILISFNDNRKQTQTDSNGYHSKKEI